MAEKTLKRKFLSGKEIAEMLEKTSLLPLKPKEAPPHLKGEVQNA